MSTPKCCMHEGEVERGIHTQGMRQVEGGIITQNKGGMTPDRESGYYRYAETHL